jgi:hypothetical protein
LKLASESINESPPPPAGRKDVYFDGNWEQVPLYLLDKLKSGDKFKSPALIIGNAQVVFVEADANVFILSSHVVIKSGQESGRTNRGSINSQTDPIIHFRTPLHVHFRTDGKHFAKNLS